MSKKPNFDAADSSDTRVNNQRMTDTLDFASELQEEMNAAAVQRVRASMAPQSHPNFDGKNCLDCGDPMAEPRLIDKRIRCTACESKHEKRCKR